MATWKTPIELLPRPTAEGANWDGNGYSWNNDSNMQRQELLHEHPVLPFRDGGGLWSPRINRKSNYVVSSFGVLTTDDTYHPARSVITPQF